VPQVTKHRLPLLLIGCVATTACGSAMIERGATSTGAGESSSTASSSSAGTSGGMTGTTASGGTSAGGSTGGHHHTTGTTGGHHTTGTTGGHTASTSTSSGGTGESTTGMSGSSSSSGGSTTTGGNMAVDGGSPVGVGSLIPWRGTATYLLGANVPWYYFGSDFGGGSNSGVSSTFSNATLATSFASLQIAGVHLVRWWMLEGAPPTQILVDDGGTPTGVDTSIYADIDSAIDLARTYDLYYDFVLFDSAVDIDAWQSDPVKRTALATALGKLFAHYATEPRILSWEVFNEPEWAIWYGSPQLDAGEVQATVKEIASAVHQNCQAYVTLGAARIDGLPLWTGLGLDYYSAHWYDAMTSPDICALCTTYGALQILYGLDAPVTIGEFEALPDAGALGRFDYFYDAGYAGAWPWSLFPSQTADMFAVDLIAEASFASAHTDIGPLTPDGG
jgi:hypothetical protein